MKNRQEGRGKGGWKHVDQIHNDASHTSNASNARNGNNGNYDRDGRTEELRPLNLVNLPEDVDEEIFGT